MQMHSNTTLPETVAYVKESFMKDKKKSSFSIQTVDDKTI